MGAMDEDTLKLYMQNLEEYVLDEGKIVTYKWLSKELSLHVNTAKQLLHTFLKKHEKDVHATYLLSGLLQDGLNHKVLIVQEDELDKIKTEFKTVSSEHVFSIQKAKQIADLNSLYIIDRYNRNEADIKRINTICCNEAVERAADEIARLKINARAAAATTDDKAWPTAPAAVNKQKTDKAPASLEEKSDAKKEESGKKRETKNAGIAAMFAAQSNKTQKQETTIKSDEKPAPKSKAKGGIAMFFNKNAEKPKVKDSPPVPKVENTPPVPKAENDDSGFESKDSQPLTDNEEHKDSENQETKKVKSKTERVQKEKKSKSSTGGKGKNKRKASDDIPNVKKRKRIVCVSDSDDSDDDIFGKDEEDEEVPLPMPLESDEEVIPPTQEREKKPGRKRERKAKVSTFMDEDGYVVTKREYVMESCTDSEGEETKENVKTKENSSDKNSPTSEPPAKKKCSPQKVKQATLMNFFKKK